MLKRYASWRGWPDPGKLTIGRYLDLIHRVIPKMQRIESGRPATLREQMQDHGGAGSSLTEMKSQAFR